MLSAGRVSAIEETAWFRTKMAPNLLVDGDLRIRAVNHAYEQVTAHPRDALVGRMLFDTFPDNPSDPHADGVANVSASIELVFRRGARHWIGVQRYDIPDRQASGEFVYRVWTPVNSPIHDEGKTVAVLHHVQDVTRVVPPPPATASVKLAQLRNAAETLGRQFPELPGEAVLNVLTHSCSVAEERSGASDFEQATALARLRLESRAGHPADEA
ncbi:PAS domain-containing protein [Mycobacterium sp. 050134]|uniref:PAS domain-containing protein n=1 Tax=Mycobacterium sp. 050134 TaxID=3096111 RepID=UPI002EDB7250